MGAPPWKPLDEDCSLVLLLMTFSLMEASMQFLPVDLLLFLLVLSERGLISQEGTEKFTLGN